MGTRSIPFHDRYIPVTESGCWLWIGEVSAGSHPYGMFQGKRAHRVSWKMRNGDIPDGFHICHKCDTPRCVNPDHLFLGTQRENVDDMNAKGRGKSGTHNRSKTHCIHGHDLTGAYLVEGRRQCRTCINNRSKEYQRKRRSK